jgi:hypothetical protein
MNLYTPAMTEQINGITFTTDPHFSNGLTCKRKSTPFAADIADAQPGVADYRPRRRKSIQRGGVVSFLSRFTDDADAMFPAVDAFFRKTTIKNLIHLLAMNTEERGLVIVVGRTH